MTGSKSKSGVQKIQTAALAALAVEGCFHVCLGRSFVFEVLRLWVVVLIVVGRKRNSGSQAGKKEILANNLNSLALV